MMASLFYNSGVGLLLTLHNQPLCSKLSGINLHSHYWLIVKYNLKVVCKSLKKMKTLDVIERKLSMK